MTRTRVLGQPEGRGQLAAHAERPLRAGPDGQLAVLPLGHRRAGLERGMGDVGDRVRLLGADVRGLQALVRSSRVGRRTRRRRRRRPAGCRSARLLQIAEQVLVGDRRAGLPLGLDRGQGARRPGARSARRRRRSRRRGRRPRPASPWPRRVSTEASVAPYEGGRSTLPCHMPGSRMSEAYWCSPVTNDRPSTFATEWPATVHSSAGVVGASSDDRLRELAALGQLAVRRASPWSWRGRRPHRPRSARRGRPSRSRPRGR